MSKLQYAFIGKEKTVWCESQPDDSNNASNKKTAMKVLNKLHSDGKYNFNLDNNRAAYAVVDKTVCFGCIVDNAITAYSKEKIKINDNKLIKN